VSTDYTIVGDLGVVQTADHTAAIADLPTVAEFEARSIPAADYTVVADLGTVQTADHTAAIADLPTVAEFEARSIPAADYTVVADLGTVQTADHTAAIADLPTVAEFEARSIPAADYTVVSDLGVVQTADHTAAIADLPTVAEFEARTIAAADYFDPAVDAVANVTLCATCTTNTDVTALAAEVGVAGAGLTAIPARTVEGAIDEIESHRLLLAGMVGKSSGGGTGTDTFRDTGDTVNRIVATVDANGNRTNVALDTSV